jgi:putative component of toxin-antitoxin plasmid stabilization module
MASDLKDPISKVRMNARIQGLTTSQRLMSGKLGTTKSSREGSFNFARAAISGRI